MAATQNVTAWDEKGNPVPDAGGAAAWDEQGNPIPVEVQQPNAAQRFSQVTTGNQHPIDELVREGRDVIQHPVEFAKSAGETVGIPREVWSDPSWKNLQRIGGTGIPGMLFGEHGLFRHPLEFGEQVTGANEAAEDVQNENWKALPGDVAGGIVNLALLKKPAESAIEQGRAAARSLKPVTPVRRVPGGAYDENAPAQTGAYEEHTESSAAERRAVPIIRSPNFDPQAYREGAKLRSTEPEEGRLQRVNSPTTGQGTVRTIPEPREPFSGEEPGYMASVPRSRLESLASSGKPGAGTQLQQLGKNVIYEPKGAGISNVKESVGPIQGNALGPNESTVDRFYDPKTRQWAPEREQIHDQVIADALKGKTPAVGRPPEATITVGGTGAGKTTLTRHVLGENPNLVNVDADVFKLKVPEFERLKAEDPQRAAFRVHEESAHMAKRTVSAAVNKGLDFIFDTSTGGGGDALFSKLKQAGYKVRVLFADVPTEDAIHRANLRARESTDPANRGRFVPEEVIREKHQVAAKAFDGYRRSPHIDELQGYDTATRTPRKFYERVGQNEQIHDSGRLEDVRRKAEGREAASRANRNEQAVLVH